MSKLFFLFLSFLTMTGCHTENNQGPSSLSTSQNNNDPYAAVREYEQNHGLYDWRTAPPVT